MTAGLLRKGTATRSAQKFAEDLDFIGADFSADASVDFTALSEEFLAKDMDRGLELFSDALLHPGFPQGEVDKLLAQDIDGVKASKDSAQSVALIYYYGYLFGNDPAFGDYFAVYTIGPAGDTLPQWDEAGQRITFTGSGHVESHVATEKNGRQITEHNVGITDSRLEAT